jgi:hypothetical protein
MSLTHVQVQSLPALNDAPKSTPPSPPRTAAAQRRTDQLAAREFVRHNDLALRVDCVNLNHPLRQIETNPRDSRQIPDRLAHGFDNDHLGALIAFGGTVHPSAADIAPAASTTCPLMRIEIKNRET